MCIIPSAPKVPLATQYQAMQAPQDPNGSRSALSSTMRRGLWASIMTSPEGVTGGAPKVTGTGTGVLGA